MSSDKTALGDRIKEFEKPSTDRHAPSAQPVIIRLDGKAFHTFTRGLPRPYDTRLMELMQETMCALVKEFRALVGYTQSDEISIVLYNTNPATQLPFNGRYQKLESVAAGFASAYFTRRLPELISERAQNIVVFDARAFSVPTLEDAYDVLLWRQRDCMRNAVSMSAQSLFSTKELHGQHTNAMLDMLARKGIDFSQYPSEFRLGAFARRATVLRTLTEEELATIPEDRRPTEPVARGIVERFTAQLAHSRDNICGIFPAQGVA